MFDNCPFCRAEVYGDELPLEQTQKRVKAGDPMAIHHLGCTYRDGGDGLEQDLSRAFELFERAAEMGSKEAHFDLAGIFDGATDYRWGVNKDKARSIEHYELAAKWGHVEARHNLGFIEYKSGNYALALKHAMISAKLGYKDALSALHVLFENGSATKSDYTEALRGYQEAVEEMSSPERDEAKIFFANMK